MNNQNNIKISHLFNLPNLNFKTQMNIPIDANAHIKNIINVESYIFENSIDAVAGKCNVKGKLGLKILYLDVDNVYNTITEETSFSEFVSDANITSDCKINMYNEQISNEIDFDDKYLKINLNIHAKLYSNIDTALTIPDTSNDNLIIKNQPISTNSCIEKLDNKHSDDCVLTLQDRASKILSVKIIPLIEKVECNSGYLTISGTNLIQTIYEVDKENFNELKLSCEVKPFKIETQATLCEPDCSANICAKINNYKNNFSTELEDVKTILKLDYEMQIYGFVYKKISLDLIEDIYSTSNEIETNFSERELCEISPFISFKGNIEGDINLLDTSADEILESVNYSCLVSQSYVDNNKIVFEGIINSTLIYLNEEKETKSMQVEMPFSISKDFELENDCETISFDIKVINCKAKIKRGNSISLDFETIIEGYIVNKCKHKMLNNIKFGKAFDYGDIAFQILATKPNEDVWTFCKRAHVTLKQLEETNNNIPPVFNGGEKMIIYR